MVSVPQAGFVKLQGLPPPMFQNVMGVSVPQAGFVKLQASPVKLIRFVRVVSVPQAGFVKLQVVCRSGIVTFQESFSPASRIRKASSWWVRDGLQVAHCFSPASRIRKASSPPPKTLTEQGFHKQFWQTSKMTSSQPTLLK